MRYAVISDVHANLEALNSVLKKICAESIDRVLFLGDSVGYGPNPNECIDILQGQTEGFPAGNHDWAAAGLTGVRYFNPYARTAIEWTADILTDKNRLFLGSLPLVKKFDDNILLVHATPREPEKWHYLSNSEDAQLNFRCFKERICFTGHSHKPAIIEHSLKGKIIFYSDRAEIKKGHRYIINAGSVGQPRDGNPDAAYALLDNNSIEIKRVSYDIVSTQRKMRDAGLPSLLIERLSKGI